MDRNMSKPTYEQIERELYELREKVIRDFADARLLTQWLDDPGRKLAIHAFTSGNERQIAYRVESLLRQNN